MVHPCAVKNDCLTTHTIRCGAVGGSMQASGSQFLLEQGGTCAA
jgi:hypothetical protein